jgi:hypothetical protein
MCALCGGAPGVRSEQCYIAEDTKAKLLAHAEDLKTFGVTLEEYRPIQKSAGDKIAMIGLALQVAESLKPGILRALILYLREIAIPKEDILRLRLDEPEQVSEVLNGEGSKNHHPDGARE